MLYVIMVFSFIIMPMILNFGKNELSAAFQEMEACIRDVSKWLTLHQLKVNCYKTECIVFRSKFTVINPIFPPLLVGNDVIYGSKSVKNLGALLDQNLTLEKHIDNLCCSANWQLRKIRLLWKYIGDKT